MICVQIAFPAPPAEWTPTTSSRHTEIRLKQKRNPLRPVEGTGKYLRNQCVNKGTHQETGLNTGLRSV